MTGTIMPHVIRATISLLCIAAFLGILFVGYMASLRLITRWKTLTRRFPATDVHTLGKKYSGQDGYFGGVKGGLYGQFRIELAQEGLLVTLWFAKRSPILIPWSDIRDAAVGDALGNILTVNYEKELKFSIPNEALTAIHENIPAERWHKGTSFSFSELIKNRLNPPRT